MSRYFMIQSWVGSHENEPDYNGQQCGERNVRSSEVVPLYDQFGNANVSAFSDEAIAQRSVKGEKKTSITLADRVLPQQRTLMRLIEQIRELEQAKRDGTYTQAEYDLLRDVLFAKKERTEYLLAKQRARKPTSASSTEGDDYTPNTSNHYQIPVQNTGNDVKLARHSAKSDLVYFVGGALALLVLVKLFF